MVGPPRKDVYGELTKQKGQAPAPRAAHRQIVSRQDRRPQNFAWSRLEDSKKEAGTDIKETKWGGGRG